VSVDVRLGELQRLALRRLMGEVRGRDFAAECAALRAEVYGARLARLVADVKGPSRARWRAAFLADGKHRAEAQRLRAEVRAARDPQYRALLASASRQRERRERAQRRRQHLSAHLLPGAGDLSRPFNLRDRAMAGLRAAAVAGDGQAGVLLAAAVAADGAEFNRAIVASAHRPGWQIRQVGEHQHATMDVFHPDGRITRHVRWKWRGMGEWITESEFTQRRRQAAQRDRQIRRQIPTVGRARTR
jgi:hypothetical protein